MDLKRLKNLSPSLKICFLGGMRYSYPLEATQDKKWKSLKDLGDLYVIGFSQDIMPRVFNQNAKFYLLPKVPFPLLRYLLLLVFGPLIALWCIYRHDVEFLTAQSTYEGFPAAIAKSISRIFRRRVALIVESHGDFEESVFLQRRILFPRAYRFAMRCVSQYVLKRAEILRAVSKATRRQLERWIPNKRIVLFPAWTDFDLFVEAGNSAKKSLAPEVVYAGLLTPLKGVHHLVRAFQAVNKEFQDARLIIIGHAENKGYFGEIKNLVSLLGLEKCVSFVPRISQSELARRLSSASVFAFPTLSEGFGRVIIEAMASSTVVVASKVGGISELIRHGETGFLVPPSDENSLSNQLLWILKHPELAEQAAIRGRNFARNFYSIEKYVSDYKRLFKAIPNFE